MALLNGNSLSVCFLTRGKIIHYFIAPASLQSQKQLASIISSTSENYSGNEPYFMLWQISDVGFFKNQNFELHKLLL